MLPYVDRFPLNITALLVSPFESDHVVMREVFSHSNWQLHSVSNSEQAIERLREQPVAVVICSADARGGWRSVLQAASTIEDPPRVIVFSRLADERLWAEVIHHGGYTLLDCPLDTRDIVTNVSLAWHSWYHEFRQTAPRKTSRPSMAETEAISATAS